MTLHIDIETNSQADLKKVGLHRYAEDPSTKVLCVATEWEDDGRAPRMVAHNAMFERTLINAVGLPGDAEWARIRAEDQSCTMARAAALSLPLGLGECTRALGAVEQKDDAGYRLMLKMCRGDYEPKPGEMERLQAYCEQDVRAERALDKLLPELTDSERRLWLLDQAINDRGFAVDLPLIEAAIKAVNEAARRADYRVFQLTNGAVTAVSQVKRIVDWLNSQGVPCESVKQDGMDDLVIRCSLFDKPEAAEVVQLRANSSRAFKFKAMFDHVCRDGRIRGSLQYHGAISGRWTGRGVQPHNFKRIEDDADEQAVADTIRVLKGQNRNPVAHVDALEVFGYRPLDALSLIARPCIIAAPGKKLVGGDFSNIEGRVNAWLNGEDWKTAAFIAYDKGEGPDSYTVTAAEALDKHTGEITRTDRQIWGKVPDLACGFQGGQHAFEKMGGKYGVKLPPAKVKAIVARWRERHPGIVAGWGELQSAGIQACEGRGAVVRCLGGRIAFRHEKGFLWCKLASGRVIAYPGAIVERKLKVVEIDGEMIEFDNWGVSYWTQKNGGWRKADLYGGAQMAHVVSGTARDVLVAAMHRLDADYPIVLTVHDEALSEVNKDFGSAEAYRRIMEVREPWFAPLPVTAKAWEGERYSK